MIIVTHEINFAREIADTMALMDQGQIIEAGAPDEMIKTPKHPRTEAFFASVKLGQDAARTALPLN